MKEFFTYLGGLVALINLLWFAKNTWTRKVSGVNPASFLMWTILDAIILFSTLAAHKSPVLPLGYTIGALTLTIAAYIREKAVWSIKEWICAAGAAITAYIWFNWNAAAGVFAGVAAMTVAGIPVWIDQWKNPIRPTWPLWFYTVVACVLTIIGSDWRPVWELGAWTGSILAWGGLVFNGSLTLVVLLRKPVQQPLAWTQHVPDPKWQTYTDCE